MPMSQPDRPFRILKERSMMTARHDVHACCAAYIVSVVALLYTLYAAITHVHVIFYMHTGICMQSCSLCVSNSPFVL